MWRHVAGNEDVRAIVPFGRGHLLVNAEHLSLREALSGRVIWVADSVAHRSDLVSTYPLLLITRGEKTATLVALDEGTGSILWRRSVASSHTLAVSPYAPYVFLAERGGRRQIRLSALDARRDTLLWVKLPRGKPRAAGRQKWEFAGRFSYGPIYRRAGATTGRVVVPPRGAGAAVLRLLPSASR